MNFLLTPRTVCLPFLLSFALTSCSGVNFFPKKDLSAKAGMRGEPRKKKQSKKYEAGPSAAVATSAAVLNAAPAKTMPSPYAAVPSFPGPEPSSEEQTAEAPEEETAQSAVKEATKSAFPVVFSQKFGASATADKSTLLIFEDHIELRTTPFADVFKKKSEMVRYGQIARVALENNILNSHLAIETWSGNAVNFRYMPRGDAEKAQKLIQDRITANSKNN